VAGETIQGERYRIRRKDGTTAPAVRSARLVTDAHDGSRRIDIFVDAVRENQGIHTSGDKTARTKP
jgi:hypothetical protein